MEAFIVDKSIKKEILISEKLKAIFLTRIFSGLIISLLICRVVVPDLLLIVFPNIESVYYSVGVLMLFIFHEYLTLRVINGKLITGGNINPKRRYFSNFIEISYPTIALVVYGFQWNSIEIIFTPVVMLYFLVLILSTLSLEFKISFYAGIIAAIGYLAVFFVIKNRSEGIIENGYYESETLHFAKAGLLILGGIISGLVANQIKKNIKTINNAILERNKIINMFGQQISSSIVDELLLKNNVIESKEQYVCVMFLDIRGFTKFAANRLPKDIINYQNDVFGFMIEIINKHHGIINQFLGDGYMATFGVPTSRGNDSQNAVNAAIEIIDALNKKNTEGEIPRTRIGIGLHSGLIVAGNVGTEKRKQYSISGNTVITAARIEQLNKTYKSQVLISREVLNNINEYDLAPTLIGDVQLKGREESTEIWQLL
ncbi:adenylate/guanylate cyclase domain-containing protein [Marinifilum caeruleilacunae]|uniref:Adenylate/guanylate cyclase domain-containing protein n=1 Tax=Marinifilum caeruleilacunae TaxID=2499076 RepID=A0ABX1X1M3_9BACT|nr:adenylate/guanylate cyclase domain-containing protein [Marinifilum caeruleilacunae]NOU62121.1 adenylate/guanylate cyclase domain-containing protein [Marinifilum caeruleilacunae]